MKLEWDFNSGGSMGPNMLLRLGGHCIGRFYEDAHSTIDVDEVREDIAASYNAHDALVAALEAVLRRCGACVGVDLLNKIDAALALARTKE